MMNALTIDLEDWYQGLTSTSLQAERWPKLESRIVATTERLLAILDRAGVRATFFVLGYVAEQFPGLVRRIADARHEIGLHGYHHRQVFRLTPGEFRSDVVKGLDAVQRASQQQVGGYRAPMFSINESSVWALRILSELGFQYDSSVFPTRNMLYGYPGAPRFPYHPFEDDTDAAMSFVEFPVSTVRALGVNWPMAGGFYLRLYPYSIFRWGLQKLNQEGHAAIVYLHPWELDPDHPRPNPTLRERFTHYHNLGLTATRLSALLDDFRFGPLSNLLPALKRRDRTSAPLLSSNGRDAKD